MAHHPDAARVALPRHAGVHYLSGTAAVPLLLVKLYTVYPKLFADVPWRRVRELSVHLAERGSIALLVGAGDLPAR